MNKSREKLVSTLFAVALIPLTLSCLASAQSMQQANQSLYDAQQAIQEMKGEGMQTNRVGDLFFQANISYQAQSALNRSGKRADFTHVLDKSEKIIEIKRTAFKVHDEIEALERRIGDLEDSNLDLKNIKSNLRDAKSEFRSERYEKASEKIDQTYQQISEAQAISTRVQAIYAATQKNIAYFIRDNWKMLTIAIVVITIFGLIIKRKVKIYLLRKKKRRLLLRKDTLKNLLEEAQRSYFEEGNMSEETYSTRTNKFGEMLRDLNRRLPLVEEELKKKTGLLKRVGIEGSAEGE